LSSKKFPTFGKRKGDSIPLLVYGRNGKKEVEDWWERWKAGVSGENEGFPS
jgi:hypothetical protein